MVENHGGEVPESRENRAFAAPPIIELKSYYLSQCSLRRSKVASDH